MRDFLINLPLFGFLIFHHADGEHHAEGGLLREDLRQAKPFNLLYGGPNRLRSHPAALCRQNQGLQPEEGGRSPRTFETRWGLLLVLIRAQAAGGKMVDADEQTEANLQAELDKVS